MGTRFGYSRDFVSNWPAPRALLQREWPAFRAAVNRIFRPAGGDLTEELPLLFGPSNRENLRVVVDAAGTVLAHAACARREAVVLKRKITVAFIAAVFVDPEVRGQRLGTGVLLDALARARPGADLVLASGDRDLYRRQGFEPVASLARFCLPPAATLAGALGEYELRQIGAGGENPTAEDLGDLQALTEAEPVHFVRSDDDWRQLLRAGRLVDVPATFTLVARGGEPVAFVATQNALPRPDGTVRPRRILEVVGDRAAVVSVAPLLGEELLVPPYDSATIDRAIGLGWVRTARQFPITADPLTPVARVVPWYGLNYL
jgi:predicted N-acetyltransferase YhbS